VTKKVVGVFGAFSYQLAIVLFMSAPYIIIKLRRYAQFLIFGKYFIIGLLGTKESLSMLPYLSMDFEQIHIVVLDLVFCFKLYNLISVAFYSHVMLCFRRGNCAFRLLYFRVNFWKIKDSKCISFLRNLLFTNIFAIFLESY
jgi:hypothetical protein